MEHRALGSSATSTASSTAPVAHREGRGTWVLTAYVISGLALFGVLAYYFSDFVTR